MPILSRFESEPATVKLASDRVQRRGRLSPVPKIPGEAREVLAEHENAEAHIAARIVRVETGEVDRQTGRPERVFYEIAAKAPGVSETSSTFSYMRNAELVFLAATYGIIDRQTRLHDLPAKLWRALRDREAFPGGWEASPLCGAPDCWCLQPRTVEHKPDVPPDGEDTRINTGANDGQSGSEPLPPKPDHPGAVDPHSGLPVEEWERLSAEIRRRDKRTCQHCGARHRLTCHHIVPRADGGTNNHRNLITMCAPCHNAAEAKIEETGRPTWPVSTRFSDTV